MGDVLRTTCILQGLREKYPQSEITWVTEKNSMDLLKNNPYIDNLLSINNVNKKDFDLIISLDEDEKACKFAADIGNNITGFYLKNKKVTPTKTAKSWFDMSILGRKPLNDILKKTNKKTYQQHMLNILDLQPKKYDLILNLDKENTEFAEEFAKKQNIKKNDLVIGLNTGAGQRWPLKSWPAENTAALADKLVKELNAKVILFGGPEEKKRNKKILNLTKSKIIDAGCNNSLLNFAALINLCNIVVVSDSLALHIVIALKKKVVVFFGVTSADEIELYGRGTKLIASKRFLATYLTTPDLNIMENLSVDEMFNAVKQV